MHKLEKIRQWVIEEWGDTTDDFLDFDCYQAMQLIDDYMGQHDISMTHDAVLAEVRAEIQKLESFQSNYALEENAYIRAIEDVIDIIDKKVSEHVS